MAAEKFTFTVAEGDAGKRLDVVLAAHVPGLSRRKARVLLDIGGVFVDRKRVKVAGRRVRAGQNIEAVMGGALDRATKTTGTAARAKDEAGLPDPRVLFEDDHVVVVDKPAGLLSTPTPESDRNNLVSVLGGELFVVHRLDLQTSGVLVLARTSDANVALSEQFRVHSVRREYHGAVDGQFPADIVKLDSAVGGKAALTHIAIEEQLDGAALIRARLETGRTHQIRIHCSEIGHPVLGDPKYGKRTDIDPPRMALHATTLGFTHPVTGEACEYTTPWPFDLSNWWERLRGA